ncbi:DNA mismatch repair protein MutS [Taibaiella soli]|uniref:DNA mismatch repair protein MutS n=1 Tax=Taibaiella soli TaxID=1649169 RepID=A0A2W2AKD4_9BACT|nr:DNA mismatch repair protein MutS [Taibaiella soli]PZF72720.1 DNA mismatch repair protein MutS [Taibaiella soli]
MAKKEAAETPLMKQHREIKNKYPDAVLLFRVGDFYETFGEDAHIASRVLGITLTKRAKDSPGAIDLAGFPHHSLDTYLHKLVKAGYRVAICDQLEDPKTVKGIVKRGVTELVTPGVASNDKLLENKTNNFLAAVFLSEQECGVAFVDISTGEFYAAQGNMEYIDKLLQSFQPSEVVLSKTQTKRFREYFDTKVYTFQLEDWIFQKQYAYDLLLQHFQTQSLKGFGLEDLTGAIIAAGAALHYLKDTEHPNLQHINALQRIVANDFLWMDRFTIRNLELLSSSDEKGTNLLSAIDRTHTPMGARLLKRWMIFPLFDKNRIEHRLDLTSFFIKNQELNHSLSQSIRQIGDVERLVGKIPLKKVNPREVLQLAKSMEFIGRIREEGLKADFLPLSQMLEAIKPLVEVQQRIRDVIVEEAPAVAAKGNMIRDGIHEELDQLRAISRDGKGYLLQIQQTESQRTGISSLKIAYNNVFGYYLEVTHAHKDKVPADWIRKQTLTSAERYVTPELKEYEEKILGAEEKILALELDIYQQLISVIDPYIATIQQNAHIIAQLDCLLSFAYIAKQYNYHRPVLADEPVLTIKNGRHPVIEQQLPPGESYVANDILLDKEAQQIIILTGPNMSGKSALLRQTAIITLMAHMGSFVPADGAQVGLTDKIFTRVGASDNLSGGESTFMVEMNETASIINNITERSLVLLDEIGRGTSTYDGISIAWSIVEYMHNHTSQAKTLFATHYHELNDLEGQLPRVKNYHITHKETGNKVIFLRKLAPGGSRHSFGIQVARMAGMPPALLERADEILATLEEKHGDAGATAQKVKQIPKANNFQLNIFDGISEDLRRVQQVLQLTDINRLTPVEALLKLNELKNIVENYQ